MVDPFSLPPGIKQTTRLLQASAMVGCDLVDHQGQTLGTVMDLVIDSTQGCIAYVVIASGGFMGLGEVRYALPWDSVVALEEQAGFRCRDAQLLARYQLA